jgi:hypothetical protein
MTEQEARPAPEIHVTDIVLPNHTIMKISTIALWIRLTLTL